MRKESDQVAASTIEEAVEVPAPAHVEEKKVEQETTTTEATKKE